MLLKNMRAPKNSKACSISQSHRCDISCKKIQKAKRIPKAEVSYKDT